MATLVCADAALGVAAILALSFHRPSSLLPVRGRDLYLAHALLGLVVTAGALALLGPARRLSRPAWVGALAGVIGIGVAGAGGLLAALQATRLLGMGLMLIGAVTAAGGYLMPLIDAVPPPGEPSRRAGSSGPGGLDGLDGLDGLGPLSAPPEGGGERGG